MTEAHLWDLELLVRQYPHAAIDLSAYLADCADGRVEQTGETL